jgi:serine/threonine-protein kinase
VAVSLFGVAAVAATAFAIVRQRPRAPSLERSVSHTSTSNTEAQDYYVSGREYERRALSAENVRSAQTQYRRALDLDSAFALARARLAITHATMYAATYDASPDRLALARAEAEAALRSQPDLGEGHLALGHVWTLRDDFGRALAEYQLALVSLPNSAEVHTAIGFALRSQGRWEEAVTRFEHAATLDSRDVGLRRQLALSQSRLRRYDAAIRTWDRVIELKPDDYHAKVIRGALYIRLDGTADSLVAALQRIPREWDPVGIATWLRFSAARIQRRPGDALAALDASRQDASGDDMFYRPRALLRAQAYDDLEDARRARAYYDTARVELEDTLAGNSQSARLRIALGLAYAGLGRRKQAVGEARAAMALVPVTSNAVAGTAIMGDAAEIYARVGDHDNAIALLGQLLDMPAGREVSVPLLRREPRWDPLRADARFARMLAGSARP